MRLDPLQLGPWPEGVDELADTTHAAFQPADDRAARLRQAVNVDLTDEGWPVLRLGLIERVPALVDGKVVFCGAGVLLLQDGDSVNGINTTTFASSPVVSGLNAAKTVLFHEIQGKVYWSNGETWGVIDSTATNVNWGMTVPPSPQLAAVAGTLPAGDYRVVCVLKDAQGVLSGAPAASNITMNGSQAFTVNLASNDSSATHALIFAGYANTSGMWLQKTVAIGALPATVSNVLTDSESSALPLSTQFLRGPPTGIEGIGSWGGHLLVWRDQYVVHTVGNHLHLFDFRTAPWTEDGDIVEAQGLEGGPCWVATSVGMVRYTGRIGQALERKPMDARQYASGSLVVSTSRLRGLEDMGGKVVIFASSDGPAIGTEDGRMLFPLQHRVTWDVESKKASILFRKNAVRGEYQLIFNLV